MRQRQQDNFSDLLKESLHENRQAGNRNSIYKQRVARREDRQSVSGDGLVNTCRPDEGTENRCVSGRGSQVISSVSSLWIKSLNIAGFHPT